MERTHDLGGLPAGKIDQTDHELTFFDKRVDALYVLLTGPQKAAFKMDEVRRTVESFSQADYFGLSYYERWLKAIALLLIEKGHVDADAFDIPKASS
ncbi:nitrile hydratase subunit beta [Marinovum sp. 2_MG-2023]|uniref:SH3-like domain-containing protein n=1 Tax=Roseobacteraceae TaxID=2854170 RepID=UPI0024550C68|nr:MULTISPECIES: SH3-like domain-containing protein [Roseobacteraceae]MDO6732899.1 nitrile hydratase subunit beta [Marinovum sp. 2_MG-2023]MDO6782171.1 nitrile hydratase subunit beta [Marinovum sp. 1_MG-2023]